MKDRIESALFCLFAIAFIASLVMLSCATVHRLGDSTPVLGQDRAVVIAWRDVYHRTEPAPAIRWVTALDCTDPDNGLPGFTAHLVTGRACRQGVTETVAECFVARGPKDAISDTTMCHEMMHAAQAYDGVFDPLHRTPSFADGGDVDRCTAALRAGGL